jgi:hypothetical protein
MILVMVMGQALSATIFGSMASLIKNLDQGHDMFTNKMDIINDHMRYYQIPDELQDDIRQFYEYVWLKHRELIFGKRHFQQISKNLEESMCAHKYRSLLKRLDFLKDSDDSLLFAFIVNLRPNVVTPG